MRGPPSTIPGNTGGHKDPVRPQQAAAATPEPEQYDPRTDSEVLANGMSQEDVKARAVPVPDLRLPRSLKDFAKKAIRALQPQGTARKPKTDAATELSRP